LHGPTTVVAMARAITPPVVHHTAAALATVAATAPRVGLAAPVAAMPGATQAAWVVAKVPHAAQHPVASPTP
jgi:hypothetical protein